MKNIITEEKQNANKEEIVDDFLNFCQLKLGYTTQAIVELIEDRDELTTLASYNVRDNGVKVYSKNRAIADILRSVAHELVHHKQLEDGRIDLNNLPQDIGGEIEDEANAVAGQLVKEFGYKNKIIYENWGKSIYSDLNQEQLFCQDSGENLMNTSNFKEDGYDLIHGFDKKPHLSEETHNKHGKVKVKNNNFKPNLRKGPYNTPIKDKKDLITLINEEKNPKTLKLIKEVLDRQLNYLTNVELLNESLDGLTINRGPIKLTYDDKINDLDIMIFNHIRKDYSDGEITNLLNDSPNDIDELLTNIFKLYGIDTPNLVTKHKSAKQYLQFMKDNGYPSDFTTYINNTLPSINEYSFVQSHILVERVVNDSEVVFYDTNYESAMCHAKQEWWDHDPQDIDSQVVDSDYIGEEEWVECFINGESVWDAHTGNTGTNNKFNPNIYC